MKVEESVKGLTVQASTFHFLVHSLERGFKREACHLLHQIDFWGSEAPMTIRVDGEVLIYGRPTGLPFREVFVRLHQHRPPNEKTEDFLDLLREHHIVGVLYAPPCERFFWG